jgi:hypothetical protein
VFAPIGDAAHGIIRLPGRGSILVCAMPPPLPKRCSIARLGLDIGALDALKRYERWLPDNFVLGTGMMFSTPAFHRCRAIRMIRDLGLGITGSHRPLRRAFMRQAGGDSGLFGSGRCRGCSVRRRRAAAASSMRSRSQSWRAAEDFTARRLASAWRRLHPKDIASRRS